MLEDRHLHAVGILVLVHVNVGKLELDQLSDVRVFSQDTQETVEQIVEVKDSILVFEAPISCGGVPCDFRQFALQFLNLLGRPVQKIGLQIELGFALV